MPTALYPVEKMPVPAPLPMHRFTVEQYHEMIRTGILTENDRVELLEGWIVDKMPQHPAHAGTISILARYLRELLPARWIVRIQSPVTLGDSEPEPDLAVAVGPEERYRGAHPDAADLAMVVEVSDTTLTEDRTRKHRVYAASRIPVYWIVNLPELAVEVYTRPRAGRSPRYLRREDYGVEFGAPVVVAGRELGGVSVRRLLT